MRKTTVNNAVVVTPSSSSAVLALAVYKLAQESAINRITAAVTAQTLAITDSTGGAISDTLDAISTVSGSAAGTGIAATAAQAYFDEVVQRHDEVVSQLNEISAAALPGTIYASVATDVGSITGGMVAFTAVAQASASLSDATSVNEWLVGIRNNISAIAALTNRILVASGLTTITDNSGGVFDVTRESSTTYKYDLSLAALSSVSTSADNVADETEFRAAMAAIKNCLSSLADKLDEIIHLETPTASVVAASSETARGAAIETAVAAR